MFKIQKLEQANSKGNNIPRTVRFPQDLFEDYNRVASETNNSFNSLVIAALRYAYSNLEIEDNFTNKKDNK